MESLRRQKANEYFRVAKQQMEAGGMNNMCAFLNFKEALQLGLSFDDMLEALEGSDELVKKIVGFYNRVNPSNPRELPADKPALPSTDG